MFCCCKVRQVLELIYSVAVSYVRLGLTRASDKYVTRGWVEVSERPTAVEAVRESRGDKRVAGYFRHEATKCMMIGSSTKGNACYIGPP